MQRLVCPYGVWSSWVYARLRLCPGLFHDPLMGGGHFVSLTSGPVPRNNGPLREHSRSNTDGLGCKGGISLLGGADLGASRCSARPVFDGYQRTTGTGRIPGPRSRIQLKRVRIIFLYRCSHSADSFYRLIENFLSPQISHMRSEIRNLGTTVQLAIKSSPHDISDPVFYIRNPRGERIPILISAFHSFDSLHQILMACCNLPETGSAYIRRGDYSIVSADGVIIPRRKLRGKVTVGVEFDMSIIKQKFGPEVLQKCDCGQTNADAIEGSWVTCVKCGAKYQVSAIREIFSPQIREQERAGRLSQGNHAEEFQLVQIFYVGVELHFRWGFCPTNNDDESGSTIPFAAQISDISDEEVPTSSDGN
ncbi:hypothetical protein B0H16DRAFT_1533194 [Mycena metata]|uniref:Ubiquitin-like domain-containing protein n=1 Tax=Mycena metata TaxID=1033252 RepID=A0AAD7JD60_9AGAR|nr:hypothetical protein B0H16DRAFT_1533194 [Mycena metata]